MGSVAGFCTVDRFFFVCEICSASKGRTFSEISPNLFYTSLESLPITCSAHQSSTQAQPPFQYYHLMCLGHYKHARRG